MSTNIDEGVSSGLKAAMRRLAATVTIVTATDGIAHHGMTATSVTSVSMAPPSLLVCINRRTRLHEIMARTEQFCVNLLHDEQIELATAFAGGLPADERFRMGIWGQNERGLAYLLDAQASVFCRTASSIQQGTHTIFIGEVVQVTVRDAVAPLVYQDAQYCRSIPTAVNSTGNSQTGLLQGRLAAPDCPVEELARA